jgi:hypothetical protein
MTRTTLDIDDDVLAAAKELARRSRRTVGAVLSALARQALTRAVPQGTGEPPAVYGFRPFPARGTPVSNATVDRLRDQEGV